MRRLIIWTFILLVVAGAPIQSAAAQGCDECQEIKRELRKAGFAEVAPATVPPAAPIVRVVL